MIEASDIESIRAIPGGVEVMLRGPAQGEHAHREQYVVEYDWQAAQQLANELGGLCAEEALRAYRA